MFNKLNCLLLYTIPQPWQLFEQLDGLLQLQPIVDALHDRIPPVSDMDVLFIIVLIFVLDYMGAYLHIKVV